MTTSVITISCQYESRGQSLGRKLAKQLDIPFYDKEIIDKTADISGLNTDYIEKQEEQFSDSLLFDLVSVLGDDERNRRISMLRQIYEAEANAIEEIAERESCVIVGRCANKVLEKTNPCPRLFIHTDLPYRCKCVSELYDIKKDHIEDYVRIVVSTALSESGKETAK